MKKILIISSNFYKDISNKMCNKARRAIEEYKNSKKKYRIKIVSVPGVFEVPVVISKNIKKYDGFVAIGCVIKGETPHFEFISNAVTQGIMNLSIQSKKPIGNGIITCLNKKQALNRIHKGTDAANAVMEVLAL